MANHKQFANKIRKVVSNVENQRQKLQEIAIEAAGHWVEHNNTDKLSILIKELEPERRWQAAMHSYITAFLAVRYDSKNSVYKAKKGTNDYEGMQAIRWDQYANEQGTGNVKGFEPLNDLRSKYRSLVKSAAKAREAASKEGADPMADMLETVYASQAADLSTLIEYRGESVPTVKDGENALTIYKDENGKHRVQVAATSESAGRASGSK